MIDDDGTGLEGLELERVTSGPSLVWVAFAWIVCCAGLAIWMLAR